MNAKLKSLIEKRNALAAEERAQLEKVEAEGRQGEATETEAYEKRAKEIDEVEKEIEKLAKWDERKRAAADRESRMKEPVSDPERPSGERKEETDPETRKAFGHYLRTGLIERRGLLASEDPKGGYLAPKEFVNEILKAETEMAPFRSMARTRQTSNRAIMIPKRTGQFAAVWVGETETRNETDGLRYGMEEIATHEMSAVVRISEQMLEDSAFDMEAEISGEISEQFAIAETTALIAGNGVKKPFGVTVDTAITDTNSGTNADFDADDLIDLLYGLKGIYQQNATWGFNRVTMRKIRKLKANNEYIWAPADNYPNNIVKGLPGTILSRPYALFPEMQDTGTTGNVSVMVGDYRRGYLIVDRVAMSVRRDPYSAASTGEILFWARKRVGGQVVMGEAIRRLKEAN